MAINFPNSPAVDDTHTVGTITYTYNGTSWDSTLSGGGSSAQTAAPTVTKIGATSGNFSFTITNNGNKSARIYNWLMDSTGTSYAREIYIIDVAANTTTSTLSAIGTFTDSSLVDNTTYRLYSIAVSEDEIASTENYISIATGAGGPTPPCLTSDTLIWLADGTSKQLKDVSVYDEIMSLIIPDLIDDDVTGWLDFETFTLEGSTISTSDVVEKGDYTSTDIYEINGIKITSYHPFFARKYNKLVYEWIRADEIQVGDFLVDSELNEEIVTTATKREGAFDIVKVDVESIDNYFVGPNKILVSNSENLEV